ncbi:MAG TPA: hypothetical protein VKN18_01270 [Blastocatellia bacterium]|nr:hypothetical protein [Blastocatellia bacterium]
MTNTSRLVLLLGLLSAVLLVVGNPTFAQTAKPEDAASRSVRAFYTYHLAHNKDFTVRNVQLRKRWLTPELYNLLLKELKRQAAASKAHPDEAPDYEGDPLTDSQEYPDSFRVVKTEMAGDVARVTVTLQWSARTSRGVDKRDITVEATKGATGWLVNDIVNSDGSKLQEDLKKKN